MNLNKAFVLGRVTDDLQLRNTPSGQTVTSFAIATNRVWTDKAGQKQEQPEFHNVVVWGRQAQIAAQFLAKGSLVLVEGRLQTRTWQNREGQNVRTTEIIVERMQLGPRSTNPGAGKRGAEDAAVREPARIADEASPAADIPTINIDEEGEIKAEDLPF